MFIREYNKTKIIIDTPAKVNLFLEVLNKRTDGFHNINSLFQSVSLFDRIEYRIIEKPEICLTVTGNQDLSSGENNLICQVYHLLREEFHLTQGMKVILEKNIPVSGGLVVGYYDSYATILAVNQLFELHLNYDDMTRLGLRLGSDIPFYFSSGQAIVTGRGEKLHESSYPVDYYLLLVTPGIAISTAESYAALRRDLTISRSPFTLEVSRSVREFLTSLSLSINDFERVQVDLYPELGRVRDTLIDHGAVLVRMSGSGPTMFGFFLENPKSVVQEIKQRGDWWIASVMPITLPNRVTKP